MHSVSDLKKLLYQTDIKASKTGIFWSKEVFLKWLSISKAPFNNFSKFSKPMAQQIESPTELQSENRPPTHFCIGKILAVEIPNDSASSVLTETATKCFLTSCCVAFFRNHFFITAAFASVS